MSSRLAGAVKNGQFVVTVECTPPRSAGTEALKACAAKLGSRVDAVCAPESEDGIRLCSLAACNHLAAAGAEPVLHLLTRDLNRIALQSAILGAASLGVTNVLCLTGRHQALTSSESARGVFDIDPVQLLQAADSIRKKGELADGTSLGSPIDLLLGTDTNPFSDPLELQVMMLEKAALSGADFVITYSVFNLVRFIKWMDIVRNRGIDSRTAIIASVMPVRSRREAAALADKYRSIDIPDEVFKRLPAEDNGKVEAVKLAAETILELRKVEGVRGVHLVTGDDFELAEDVIEAAGLSRS